MPNELLKGSKGQAMIQSVMGLPVALLMVSILFFLIYHSFQSLMARHCLQRYLICLRSNQTTHCEPYALKHWPPLQFWWESAPQLQHQRRGLSLEGQLQWQILNRRIRIQQEI